MIPSSLGLRQKFLVGAALAATATIGLQAGESKAQAVRCSVTSIVSGSCSSLTIGDKRVDIARDAFSGYTPGADDEVIFNEFATNQYQLQYNFAPTQGGTTPVSGQFRYTINVIEPGLSAGNKLTFAQSNITGGTLAGGGFTTTATSAQLPGGSLTASSLGNPSVIGAFAANTTVAAFTQTFATTGAGTINSFGLQFAQVIPPPQTQVPGPLPILGAGAAFGFSRKLRRRTRQVA